MLSFEETLKKEYWGNTVEQYAIALGIVVIGLLVLRIFRKFLIRKVRVWVEKSENTIDDVIEHALEKFGLPILSFCIIYWGVATLTLSQKVDRVVNVATSVVIAFFVLRLISSIIELLLTSYIRKQENGETKVKQVGGIMMILNIVIWVLGALFLFDNLGYNVSTILTGVGIGGIAIALAAQNIVGDLFNYFVIFFDKPFEVGDSINVDDKNGTIEYIGVKTTRLRSVSGEQIVIANSDLTKSRVHNFKRQETRRVTFTVMVVFHTSIEKLRTIPDMIKKIIEEAENTRFDRAHFARFTEYGLAFDVVYYVTVPEYIKYMDVQQEVNFKLMEYFEKENIHFLIREDRPGEWDNQK